MGGTRGVGFGFVLIAGMAMSFAALGNELPHPSQHFKTRAAEGLAGGAKR